MADITEEKIEDVEKAVLAFEENKDYEKKMEEFQSQIKNDF